MSSKKLSQDGRRSKRKKKREAKLSCFSNALAKVPNFRAISAQATRDGLFVLPACQDRAEKHPAIAWKQYQQRRPTEAEVAAWLERYSCRNGVYPTGPILGRFVVDCDNAAAVAWLRRRGIPSTQQVTTSRGRHFHFTYPDFHVRNSAGVVHEGVDIRGAGGIAVAVGSLHPSGFRYDWARGCSPDNVELADGSEWLLDGLRERSDRRTVRGTPIEPRPFSGTVSPWATAVIDRELLELSRAPQGTRNNALARVAFKMGQLAGGGEAQEEELIAAIEEVARLWPNFEKSRDTIRRAFDAGAAKPRCAPPSFEQQLIALRVMYG